MTTSRAGLTCIGCGEAITEDQTTLRLTAGIGTAAGAFSGVFRPDVYLHAGRTERGPWDDAPVVERWCATPENVRKALWALYLDATTGSSGTYGGE